MMSAESFAEMPFGGWGGERLPVVRPEAAPLPPQPLVIEPPPWAGIEADPTVAAPVPQLLPDALAVMKAADDDSDRWPDPTAPVEVVAPLVRFVPPAADWREEEAERQRQRTAEAQDRLESSRDPYPARPAAQKGPRWP
jgi:hypothetical protein